MLSKELLELFRAQSAEVFVDSVGDDVYSWAVELAAFARGSGLAQVWAVRGVCAGGCVRGRTCMCTGSWRVVVVGVLESSSDLVCLGSWCEAVQIL